MEHNDHRQLGQKLDLFHFEEEAPGMIFWHARGYRIYRAIEDHIRGKMDRLGYQEVQTPQLLPSSLWERSGHMEKFKENMFCLPVEGGRDLALKPMSCPCHVEIFNHELRSWRDLPMRFSEFGSCHRNEPSGSLHGLMRTRAFEQDDAHVLCEAEHIRFEVERFSSLVREAYKDFGFDDFEVALSLRPDKRAGSDDLWDWAEEELLAAARGAGFEPKILRGEGAFYGPKLEFSLKDRMGRSWQCGTVQLDSVLPGRLGASYIDKSGNPSVPFMIHHAVLGSIGRFIGILLEHYEGKLPMWLSPDQVAVLPISDELHGPAKDVCDAMRAAGLRVVFMGENETLSRRIVNVHDAMIPAFAVIGKREAESGSVALTLMGKKYVVDINEAVSMLKAS
jgi:threonyl-tRNA synthetase